jgi:hypothetical protein
VNRNDGYTLFQEQPYPDFTGGGSSMPSIFDPRVTEPNCIAPCPYPDHIHDTDLPSGGKPIQDSETTSIRRSSWWLEVPDDE